MNDDILQAFAIEDEENPENLIDHDSEPGKTILVKSIEEVEYFNGDEWTNHSFRLFPYGDVSYSQMKTWERSENHEPVVVDSQYLFNHLARLFEIAQAGQQNR